VLLCCALNEIISDMGKETRKRCKSIADDDAGLKEEVSERGTELCSLLAWSELPSSLPTDRSRLRWVPSAVAMPWLEA
jgi:hypothetical protein